MKNKRLLNKALKNSFKIKPSKGYKFLENLSPGAVFITSTKMKGVLLECETNAKVIIMEVPNTSPEDRSYYLGKQIIGAKTEVKEV